MGLICLLGLEGILLSLMFIYLVIRSSVDLFILFCILRFAACEASLGLACLVVIVRSYGSDIFFILLVYTIIFYGFVVLIFMIYIPMLSVNIINSLFVMDRLRCVLIMLTI